MSVPSDSKSTVSEKTTEKASVIDTIRAAIMTEMAAKQTLDATVTRLAELLEDVPLAHMLVRTIRTDVHTKTAAQLLAENWNTDKDKEVIATVVVPETTNKPTPIPGKPGYMADIYGDIYSAKTIGKLHKMTAKQITAGAKRWVALHINKKALQCPVGELVALTFLGPCPAGHKLVRKNNNPADDRLENLEYRKISRT